MKRFRIVGKVLVAESGEGVAGLTVEATDKDLLVDDHLGAVSTGEDGRFEISYEEQAFMDLIFDRRPDVYLRIKDKEGNLLHTTAGHVRYDAGEVEEFIIRIPRAQLTGEEEPMTDDIPRARGEFRQLLLENLNYFGTYPELDLEVVEAKEGDTRYEELRCLGYYPEQDLLEAVLDIKRPTGYKSSLCGNGSYEYVRFFVDWDGDGKFDGAGEDAGIVSVNVHNIPNEDGPCRERSKPLSYAVRLQLDPHKSRCEEPYLVKVRAILSWDTPPPAGMPDKPPVWGNVLEGWIQIEPRPRRWFDVVEALELDKTQIDPDLLQEALPISPKAYTLAELEDLYEAEEVPIHRYNYAELAPLAAQVQNDPPLMATYLQNPAMADIVADLKAVLAEKTETRYEELECVGLHYDQDQLAATMTIKRPSGYNGDLCSRGSREYVAFWAYLYDQIEQQCIWRYLGTANVNVHDIPNIPDEGLQYAVYLPVDFSDYRRPCGQPQILRIRAVLSWNTPPSTINPYKEPRWGNIRESLVQLKPSTVTTGERKPFIWALGNMAVESISGNVYTTVGSTLGDGYANGPSVGAGFSAVESPFGSRIHISGTITNPPNNPAEVDKLRYKVQYRKLGASPGPWRDITDNFTIWRRIDGVPVGSMLQSADAAGYFRYQKDLAPPTQVEVLFDTLAIWHTPVAEGDGLYGVRVLLYQPGAPATATSPADHVASEVIKIQIDNTAPSAAISLDAGPCEKFKVGDTFTGKFTATDKHIWKYSLSVSPGVANPPTLSPTGETYPALPVPGRVNHTFTVTTTESTTPCGYVIDLYVWDRTIRNNHMSGNRGHDDVGLCLLEEE